MSLFGRILFPVDFSKRCHAVAPAVRAMAERKHAMLTLLHSYELPVSGYGDSYALTSATIDEFRDASVSGMDRFLRQHFSGMEAAAASVVKLGAPVESIVEFVNENAVDLIMMPSHGRGRFRSLLIGSVTTGVLHDTHCAVWMDAHCEQAPPVVGAPKKIVCAIDLSAKSVEQLRLAKRIACEEQAELRVVYAEPAIEDYTRSANAARFRRFLEFRAREEYEPMAQQVNLPGQLEVVDGAIGEAIAQAVRRHKADLLIIGRGVIDERFGRLRTDAYDIIRKSPCPVLSV